ncbi:Cytochrome c [compost metagenome]
MDDPAVLAGKQAFYEAGCAGCHVPKFVTSKAADNPALRFQLIWPYSDFLLHDMGEGLADHRPEGQADGYEWRTPPLWGIGLTQTVSGHSFFLHDGRARNLTEAILWHGGEAQAARDAFATMSADQRADLLTFLESL